MSRILDHTAIIGLNIARGSPTKYVNYLADQRCTHITALLQAMAPAVVQATGHGVRKRRDDGVAPGGSRKNREKCSLEYQHMSCVGRRR
ncbi:MAG: hypothetical protein CM15mP49_23590 [Actinomycetota bacterium]|nr:MAG: hypothetical protein CM15mP49_23590 [Actinomycetota bacterium]